MTKKFFVLLVMVSMLIPTLGAAAGEQTEKKSEVAKKEHNQLIIWAGGDREVALKLVLMYSFYSTKNKWMDKVRLLVWGPSAKLLSEDKELQQKIKELKDVGVELWACKACADLYEVSDKLAAMGIMVHYTGKHLAQMQKDGWHVLTF